MKNASIIAALLAAACSIPPAALGDPKGSLEELFFLDIPNVVGVSKSVEKSADAPMSVYVASREDLERWGVRGLFETQGRMPGYNFYNGDYFGQNGTISRGTFMIWRFGMSIELMPLLDYGDLHLPVAFLKNVEVARGGGSLTWGSAAQAGLTNFNLRDDLDGPELRVEAGNSDHESVSYMYGKKQLGGDPDSSLFVGTNFRKQDAVVYHPGVDYDSPPHQIWRSYGYRPSYTLVAKMQLKDFKFLAFRDRMNYDSASGQVNGSQALYDDVERMTGHIPAENLELESYRVEYRVPALNAAWSDFYLYGNYLRKEWWIMPIAIDAPRRYDLGYNGKLNLFDGFLDVDYGGDLWSHLVQYSPSMFNPFALTYEPSFFAGILEEKHFSYRNGYIQGKARVTDKVKLVVGGRYDHQDGVKDLYSGPRLGVIYDPSKSWTFKYLYNRSARRPSAVELLGATHPREDWLMSNEVVASYTTADTVANLTLYTQGLKDALTRDPNSFDDVYNAGGVRSSGVEWDLKHYFKKDFLVYWNGSFQKAKSKAAEVTLLDGSTADLSLSHNQAGEPLFIPRSSQFIGTEVGVMDTVKVNVDVRSSYRIPYVAANGVDQKSVTVHVADLIVRSRKFWNRVELGFVVLNVFNNRQKVPAFGETAQNANGLIPSEARKYFVRATLNW